MGKSKIELDLDSNLKGTLIITCGKCARKTKLPLKQATPNRQITCSCGDIFVLSGDYLRKMQKAFDELSKTRSRFKR